MDFLRRFTKCLAIIVAAVALVAFASLTTLRAQIRQCQDPDFFCEPKGCTEESGECPDVPLFYTAITVEPQLVGICALGTQPDCQNAQVATCITKRWVADATKKCGTVLCYTPNFAMGCPE